LSGLPSFDAVAPTAVEAARRTLAFQTLNLSEVHGGHGELKRWATDSTPHGTRLHWWEVAAAAGSSLSVHALMAAASQPDLARSEARQIDGAYFPWIGSLHTLLDSLVDQGEDHEQGQRSLLGYYNSPTDAAIRLSGLLTAMCSYYLSAPECRTAEGQAVTRALTRTLGLPLDVAMLMFRLRRRLHTLTDSVYT
jgi:hypothetical protein